jgi:predicted DNA-binding protein
MSRSKVIYEREQVHIWLMTNQVKDIKKLQEKTGKTKTDIISEALAMYFKQMADWKVL